MEKINLLLTRHKGHTGEYWYKFVAVQAFLHLVHSKMAKGQYSTVWLKQARCLCSLLHGIQALNLSASKKKILLHQERAKNTDKMWQNPDQEITDWPKNYCVI